MPSTANKTRGTSLPSHRITFINPGAGGVAHYGDSPSVSGR